METRKISVELTDRELDILRTVAERQNTTATAALKQILAMADYLYRQIDQDNQILVGRVKGNKILGNVRQVKFD